MKTWTVPGDVPNLEAGLAAAAEGDVLQLEGVHIVEMTIVTKAVTIRGGVLRGKEPVVLAIRADATITGLRVENDHHGIVVKAGSPTLEDLELSVGGTAIACGWEVTPRINRVRAERCAIGLSVQDKAAPIAEDLKITASGSGLFFTGEARGTVSACAIAAGQMAGVEVGADAAPTLVGVTVAAAGRGAFFIHGNAKPRLHGCAALHCGLAALEVTGDADPTIDGFLVRDSGASGLFLHGQSKGTYLEIQVEGGALASIEISEDARPELERGLLEGSNSGGIWVHDDAVAELVDFEVNRCAFQALEISDNAEVRAEGCTLSRMTSHGVLLRDKARLGLVDCTIVEGMDCGLLGQDAARATVEGGRIAGHRGSAVRSEGGAVFVLDPLVEVTGTTESLGHGAIHRVGDP